MVSAGNGKTYSFEEKVPYAPLSPVWAQVPVGNFEVRVVGLSASGEYPTFFSRGKTPMWLNSTLYPAKVLMNLERNIMKGNKG